MELNELELVREVNLDWADEYGWMVARGICLADLHHMADNDEGAQEILEASLTTALGTLVNERALQMADHYARVLLLGRPDMVGSRYTIESDEDDDVQAREVHETVAAYLSALVAQDYDGRTQLVATSEPEVVIATVQTLFRLANQHARVKASE